MKLGRPITFKWTIAGLYYQGVSKELVDKIVTAIAPNQRYYRFDLQTKLYDREAYAVQTWKID